MIERLAGGRRAGRGVDVEDLAPDVCAASDLGDPLTIEPVEAGIAVSMKIAPEPGEVRGRALALASGA